MHLEAKASATHQTRIVNADSSEQPHSSELGSSSLQLIVPFTFVTTCELARNFDLDHFD